MCENKIISKSHHCQIYFKIKYWKIRISVNKKQVSCFFEHKCECKNYVTTPNHDFCIDLISPEIALSSSVYY
jgi:hypothetical protein